MVKDEGHLAEFVGGEEMEYELIAYLKNLIRKWGRAIRW